MGGSGLSFRMFEEEGLGALFESFQRRWREMGRVGYFYFLEGGGVVVIVGIITWRRFLLQAS